MENYAITGYMFTRVVQEEMKGFRHDGVLYTPAIEPTNWSSGVKRLISFGATPASIDHLIKLRAHLKGGDHSRDYIFSGTLRLQTGSGTGRRVSFGELTLQDWEKLALYLSDNQNFVDLSKKDQNHGVLIGKLEAAFNRGKYEVPANDLAFSTADTSYETNPQVTAIMPTNAGLNKRIIRETNNTLPARVWYSQADLDSEVVRVGPVGLGGDVGSISSVDADDNFSSVARARGEAPPSAQKK